MREGLQKIVPHEDTIVAISTPIGRSGIGVVRISGIAARSLAQRFLRSTEGLSHRRAIVGSWINVEGACVDDVVATFFEGPRSYTGEDVLEVSAHGNPLILTRIVEDALKSGARIASPGEFTLRAVLHQKMDLVQAEAVRDFINAQTDAQARNAQRQLGGALSKRIRPVKDRLVDVIAHLEAGIDFADDDIEQPNDAFAAERIGSLHAELALLQKTYAYGRHLSDGLRLAIIGKPNVGKSSLFNRLVDADRAIVTEIPGTTRDVLAETCSFEGVPLRFFDTAGLRETSDLVEEIGVARSWETFSEADLVLVVLDGSAPLDREDQSVLSRASRVPHHVIVNKSDLPPAFDLEILGEANVVRISAKTGQGLDCFYDALRGFLHAGAGEAAMSDCLLTNSRQNEAINRATKALEDALHAMQTKTPHEMTLLDLYRGLGALNELTGDVSTDDILGRIFSTFCVGK